MQTIIMEQCCDQARHVFVRLLSVRSVTIKLMCAGNNNNKTAPATGSGPNNAIILELRDRNTKMGISFDECLATSRSKGFCELNQTKMQ